MIKTVLLTCKPDYEKVLTKEIALYNLALETKGNGWIIARTQQNIPDLCFSNNILANPISVKAPSINSLADNLLKLFTENIKDKQITEPWPLSFSCGDNEKLIRHTKSVFKTWTSKTAKKISRVMKLSKEGIPHGKTFEQGFFVHFTDFNQTYVSFNAFSAGQQRMHMDQRAPSRSYLKLEEAFRIFNHEPKPNQAVIDLGAAPGGWSYSALKRGAIVIALDNGPLREPVKSDPNITHLKIDALKYKPNTTVDWMLCDILEEPDIILNLIHKWLNQKWCKYFIVNLKVGRNDPVMLLKKIRDQKKGLAPYCKLLQIRQLYHDREEITLMGQTK